MIFSVMSLSSKLGIVRVVRNLIAVESNAHSSRLCCGCIDGYVRDEQSALQVCWFLGSNYLHLRCVDDRYQIREDSAD